MAPRAGGLLVAALLVFLLCIGRAAGYSSAAGSCEHAGVNHGMERYQAQEGSGNFMVSLGKPGINVPGATVTVKLSGVRPFKGFLLFAEVNGKKVGHFAATQPDGTQVHPSCPHAATHKGSHTGGRLLDELSWVVPDSLTAGDELTFKATVVKSYAKWHALSRSYAVGSAEGGGTDEDESAPLRAAALAEAAALLAARRRTTFLRVVHGLAMASAWVLLAPLGVIAARYFKHHDPAWFVAHRRLQWATVGLTVASFALAALVLHPHLPYGRHGTLGAVVAIAALLQPAIAAFRPAKAASSRPAWRRLHQALGLSTLAGGLYNVGLGIQLLARKEGGDGTVWWVGVGAAGALVAIAAAALEVRARGWREGGGKAKHAI